MASRARTTSAIYPCAAAAARWIIRWSASWVHVPTARLVNDLRFQLARRDVDLTPNSAGPMLEIPGVVTLGQSYRLNASRQEDHGEIVESLNYSVGRSQFNIGFNLHQVRLDARMANRFAGVYLFPRWPISGRPARRILPGVRKSGDTSSARCRSASGCRTAGSRLPA